MKTDSAGDGNVPRMARRWRTPVIVLATAVVNAVAGFAAADQLQQPDVVDPRAFDNGPVAVDVERRALESTVVVRGEVTYAEPITPRLAGSVFAPDPDLDLVVTRPAMPGSQLTNGSVLLEVSGRPVFVLIGTLPMYRPLGEGATGADVAQLEKALAAAGQDPGSRDGVYDASLQRAVDRLYKANGYAAPQPTSDAVESINAKRDTVRRSEAAVDEARTALDQIVRVAEGSALLEAQRDLAAAEAELAETQVQVGRANAEAGLALDAARNTAEVARSAVAEAEQTGRDPRNPNLTCTPTCLAELRHAVTEAEARIVTSELDRDRVHAAGEAVLAKARLGVDAARAMLEEIDGGAAVARASRDLDRAEDELIQARTELNQAIGRGRAALPKGELLFLPRLPLTVREPKALVGHEATGDLAVLTTNQRVVRATVPLADLSAIRVGMAARLDSGRGTEAVRGSVLAVTHQSDATEGDSESVGEIIVDASGVLAEFATGHTLRVVVPIQTSSGKVLVVPLASVTTTASGESVVNVLGSGGSSARRLTVRLGMSADGLIEVEPVNGPLDVGDRVVVGE